MTPGERIIERLEHHSRQMLNGIWKTGGCEAVDALLSAAGLMCPLCGNKEATGEKKIRTKFIEATTVDGRLAGRWKVTCGKCGHEWEASE